jgi:protocatechuate 3,4-dioxygenase beta subunit
VKEKSAEQGDRREDLCNTREVAGIERTRTSIVLHALQRGRDPDVELRAGLPSPLRRREMMPFSGVKHRAILALALLWGAGCALSVQTAAGQAPPASAGVVPVIGLPCEGCEAVFEGIPASPDWNARIAPEGAPGEALLIDGVARRADGSVAPGIIIYAYHTNMQGFYPPYDAPGAAASRHGSLRGWALTDSAGRYRFHTIRPGSYPSRTEPAHVHMHVIEPACCTYYIASVVLDDDPLLTEAIRRGARTGRGGSGLVRPVRDATGTWRVTRDISLGAGVPGYPRSIPPIRW